ncbi:MAG: AAA family ATPase [Acidobacteriota bacterium]|nr:AAA family ATPase [Acidobacteriota bacterium]
MDIDNGTTSADNDLEPTSVTITDDVLSEAEDERPSITDAGSNLPEDDIALAKHLKEGYEQVTTEVHKIIVGQNEVVEQVLLTLFVGGNSIITGVPGLAKTLLVQTLADVLDLEYARIQFTPDLMPADITGTEVIQQNPETGERNLQFVKGPVFTNILLADEINRTPPKTQSALLEAMQEHQVSAHGETYQLEEPFLVLATQNPIELEGTYPLPEAQLDRFMFNIIIEHPPLEEELQVVRETTKTKDVAFEKTITGSDIIAFQKLVRRVPVSDAVMDFTVDMVRKTRPENPGAPKFIEQWIEYGASVRAAQYLILGGKARALLHGRYYVDFDDIRHLAAPILRHRILTNFHAQSEQVTTDQVIAQLLDTVSTPVSRM